MNFNTGLVSTVIDFDTWLYIEKLKLVQEREQIMSIPRFDKALILGRLGFLYITYIIIVI